MSYKKGDRVIWTAGPGRPEGVLSDGPFTVKSAKLADITHWPDSIWGPTWVVDFCADDQRWGALLLAETVLDHIYEWEPCSGEHRLVAEDAPALGWERQKP